MKLPKTLMLCLLIASAGASVLALGTWWTTGPLRTARQLVEFVNEGNLEEANAITSGARWVDDEDSTVTRLDMIPLASLYYSAPQVRIDPRSILDCCRGRLTFSLVDADADPLKEQTQRQARFIAEGERIEVEWRGRDI